MSPSDYHNNFNQANKMDTSQNVGALASIADNMSSTLAPILALAASNSNKTGPNVHLDVCSDCKHLTWVKLGILAAILICLIMIKVVFCVAACYLMGTLNNQRTADMEQQIIGSREPVREPAGLVITQSPAVGHRRDLTMPYGPNMIRSEHRIPANFKQLGGPSTTLPRPPLSSSLESNTFSEYMSPPKPRGQSLGPGLESPEETMVKRLALDKMQREEAKRHQDLTLMANKSSSLTKIGDELLLKEAGGRPQVPLRERV